MSRPEDSSAVFKREEVSGYYLNAIGVNSPGLLASSDNRIPEPNPARVGPQRVHGVAKAYLVARLVAFQATMENATCNVIYVDRRVRDDRYIARGQAVDDAEWEAESIAENSKLLMDIFGSGMPDRLFRR